MKDCLDALPKNRSLPKISRDLDAAELPNSQIQFLAEIICLVQMGCFGNAGLAIGVAARPAPSKNDNYVLLHFFTRFP